MKTIRLLGGVFAVAALLSRCPSRPCRRLSRESRRDGQSQTREALRRRWSERVGRHGLGILVSLDGYILTVYSHMLDTQDLRVHLWDGTRYHGEVVAMEPELDVALIKIGSDKEKIDDALPYFDVFEAAKQPVADAGTSIVAFSNQFEIATRDEPMSENAASWRRMRNCTVKAASATQPSPATSTLSTPSRTTPAPAAAPSRTARASCSASSARSCTTN